MMAWHSESHAGDVGKYTECESYV